MEIYVLDANYEPVALIDEADSILWDKKYNDIGECEIYTPCNEDMLALLKKGNYLFRYDDDMFCKIEKVEIETNEEEGDYIIATATDIFNVLAGRVVRWQIVHSGTVAAFIKKVLTDNVINPAQRQRAIPNFEIDTSNFAELTDTLEISVLGDDIAQLIMTTCKTYNYGFRLSYNIQTRKLVFRLYKGKDKATMESDEYVEFSPQFANILSSNYVEDDSNYKNVAYVAYNNEAGETALLSYFEGDTEPQGEARREVYVDGTSTSRNITKEELLAIFPTATHSGTTYPYYITVNGETIIVAKSEGAGENEKITVTDYTYLLLIRRLAQNTLAERVKTQEFEGSVDTLDTYVYKNDYDLGDIVKVVNEYGIEAQAQIVSIIESEDNEDGYIVEPTFEYMR